MKAHFATGKLNKNKIEKNAINLQLISLGLHKAKTDPPCCF